MLLLDDVMAAVDARVAAWLLRHALLGPLLWGQASKPGDLATGGHTASKQAGLRRRPRTVVVATHSADLLAAADWVVEMRGGAVAAVRQQPEAAARRREAVAAAAADEDTGAGKPPAAAAAAAAEAGSSSDAEEGLQGERALPRQAEEERQMGHVRWAVYRRYAAATGWGWVALILSSLALMQVGWVWGGRLPQPMQRCPVYAWVPRSSTHTPVHLPRHFVTIPAAGHPQRQRPVAVPLGVVHSRHRPPAAWW